jgi:hypothetical protein
MAVLSLTEHSIALMAVAQEEALGSQPVPLPLETGKELRSVAINFGFCLFLSSKLLPIHSEREIEKILSREL